MGDNSEITFVSPYLDAQTRTIMMTLATRLNDGVSVLALDISLEQIQAITEEIARQTPNSFCFMLNKDGLVIAHSDPEELGKNYLVETGSLVSLSFIRCMLPESISLNCSTASRNTWFTPKTWKAAGTALLW